MPSLYVWQAHGDGRGAFEQYLCLCVIIYARTSRCAAQMPRVTTPAVAMCHMCNSPACEDEEVCMCASARQWSNDIEIERERAQLEKAFRSSIAPKADEARRP
mgnify:FL=1